MQDNILKIENLIRKIDTTTAEYLELVKNTDEYNSKKFYETIQLLDYLRKQLDERVAAPKTEIEFDLPL